MDSAQDGHSEQGSSDKAPKSASGPLSRRALGKGLLAGASAVGLNLLLANRAMGQPEPPLPEGVDIAPQAVLDLPLGAWSFNGNGYTGALNIAVHNLATHQISGTVLGNAFFGYWDPISRKILFMRQAVPANPATFQIYTGYRFQNPIAPTPGQIVTITLTGSFEAFAGSGAVYYRTVYGWFAQKRVTAT